MALAPDSVDVYLYGVEYPYGAKVLVISALTFELVRVSPSRYEQQQAVGDGSDDSFWRHRGARRLIVSDDNTQLFGIGWDGDVVTWDGAHPPRSLARHRPPCRRTLGVERSTWHTLSARNLSPQLTRYLYRCFDLAVNTLLPLSWHYDSSQRLSDSNTWYKGTAELAFSKDSSALFLGGHSGRLHRMALRAESPPSVHLHQTQLRNCSSSGTLQAQGGGLLAHESRVSIRNVTFSDCTAVGWPPTHYFTECLKGGAQAMFCDYMAHGGGVALLGSSVTIEDTSFDNCSATFDVVDSMRGVKGYEGERQAGGGLFASNTSGVLSNNIFTNCTAGMDGRGAALANDNQPKTGTMALRFSRFDHNRGPSAVTAMAPIEWACFPGQWSGATGEFSGDFHGCPSTCAAGFHGADSNFQIATCKGPCTRGHYCEMGTARPAPCPQGTHMPVPGASALESCLPCAPGAHQPDTGQTSCRTCRAGSFSTAVGSTHCEACFAGGYCAVEGAATSMVWTPCPAGWWSAALGANSSATCVPCATGLYSSQRGEASVVACVPCREGSIAPHPGHAKCALCEAGTYADDAGATACKPCRRGFYCPAGSSTPRPCPGGTYGNGTGLASEAGCAAVGKGYWAPVGTALPIACPASGFYCPGKAHDELYGGAQPIIIPTGQTTTVETSEVVQKEVTLSIPLSEYNATALRHELAALYNISVELIELSDPFDSSSASRRSLRRARALAAGGISITITIRTAAMSAPTTTNSAPASGVPASRSAPTASHILTALNAISDATLSSTLGVNLTSSVPIETSMALVVESVCPKGHWCSAGKITPCKPGYYNPNINQDTASGCLQCPLYSSTRSSAAVNSSLCVCNPGFVATFANGVDKTAGFTCICPAGTEKVGDAVGNVICGKCASGMFKDNPNGEDTVCGACPQLNAVSQPGATSVEQCGCPARKFKRLSDGKCEDCPIGAVCAEETVPAALNLTAGHWRTDANSTIIETCQSAAACLGGVNLSLYCPPGSTGPLCAVCADGFRRTNQDGCVVCGGGMPFADLLPLLVVVVVLGPFLFVCCSLARRRRHHRRLLLKRSSTSGVAAAEPPRPRAYRERPKQMAQRVLTSAIVKLKIFTSFQQVLQGLAGVFQISWPAAFKELLSWLSVFNFDFLSILPIDCVLPYNYISGLYVRTLVPLGAVVLLVLSGRWALRRGKEGLGYLLFNGGVVLTFLCYPAITRSVFRFFQRHQFDGTYGTFLSADYAIRADASPEAWAYNATLPFAVIMIFVWPIGVPALILVLLWRSRTSLLEIRRREVLLPASGGGVPSYDGDTWAEHVAQSGRGGGASDARDVAEVSVEGYLWSLTESYRGSVFYFEVVEYVLQKLILIGLMVFFQPGSLPQLTLGLIVCFLYFGLCCYLLPFAGYTDNLMACVTQFSLFVAMLTAVIIKYGGDAEVPPSVLLTLTVAACVPAALSILLTVNQLFEELGCDPLGAAYAPLQRAFVRRVHRTRPAALLPGSPREPPSISVLPAPSPHLSLQSQTAPAPATRTHTTAHHSAADGIDELVWLQARLAEAEGEKAEAEREKAEMAQAVEELNAQLRAAATTASLGFRPRSDVAPLRGVVTAQELPPPSQLPAPTSHATNLWTEPQKDDGLQDRKDASLHA